MATDRGFIWGVAILPFMVEQTELLLYGLVALGFGFLFFNLFLQRQETRRLSETLHETLRTLNISQKKGEAGENLVYKISESMIEAGVLEKKIVLPDKKEMDFAALLGSSENGERLYIPVDSKVNKAPIKVIEEISKYTGLQFGSGIRTTTFAIVGYPDDEEQKYMEKRTEARMQAVFFVKMSQLPAYLNFIRWYHDNIAPLESASYRIGQVLILFKSHYAQIQKEFNEVDQKMRKLSQTLKFAPVGENLRQAIASAEAAVEGTSSAALPAQPASTPDDDGGVGQSSQTETTEDGAESEVEDESTEPTGPYVFPDDTPLKKFKPKGFGAAKQALLAEQGYETVGEMRGLSLGDLVAYGYSEGLAETIHEALNARA
jgi:hypothetical protein